MLSTNTTNGPVRSLTLNPIKFTTSLWIVRVWSIEKETDHMIAIGMDVHSSKTTA